MVHLRNYFLREGKLSQRGRLYRPRLEKEEDISGHPNKVVIAQLRINETSAIGLKIKVLADGV